MKMVRKPGRFFNRWFYVNHPGLNNNKKLQTRKPDSVSKLSFIWDADCSAPLSAYPSRHNCLAADMNEQFTCTRCLTAPCTNRDIHGISACKVYPPGMLPSTGRRLLPYIFTLTRNVRAVILCGTFYPMTINVPIHHHQPGCSPVHCSMLSGLSFLR